MRRFNDFKRISPRLQYIDGALGGLTEPSGAFSMSAQFRASFGYEVGKANVEEIVNSLTRTNGVISESLRIVTHSMGGAYGYGFVTAIIEWAKENPDKAKGLQIDVYNFAFFQQNLFDAIEGVTTYQFDNKGDVVVGYGLVGGSIFHKQKGVRKRDKKKGGHSIFDFKNRIENLEEGNYKFIDGEFVEQK
jgi:hypothetical protein